MISARRWFTRVLQPVVAGGFAETCGIYGGCKPFNSEENDSFEVGLKADLMDGRMRLNLALYDVTYESLARCGSGC